MHIFLKKYLLIGLLISLPMMLSACGDDAKQDPKYARIGGLDALLKLCHYKLQGRLGLPELVLPIRITNIKIDEAAKYTRYNADIDSIQIFSPGYGSNKKYILERHLPGNCNVSVEQNPAGKWETKAEIKVKFDSPSEGYEIWKKDNGDFVNQASQIVIKASEWYID